MISKSLSRKLELCMGILYSAAWVFTEHVLMDGLEHKTDGDQRGDNTQDLRYIDGEPGRVALNAAHL